MTFQKQLGMSSSQHFRTPSFFRGVGSSLCALLAGSGHTVKITIFDREKSKSRKVEKFTFQEISARKVEKFEKFEKFEKSKSRKVEKSKKSKKSKSRKVENFLTF